ncbi:MAG: carotenoid biosynthesis protein [Clostridiaceae bacterium]
MEKPEMRIFIHRLALFFLMIFALLTSALVVLMMLGKAIPPWTTFASTFASFFFAILHASVRLGWKQALTLIALCFGVSLLFESLGVATGLVYGPYHYSDQLGPKFLNLVPYLIPLAWFMMMYPAFLMARWLTPRLKKRWIQVAALAGVTGLIMTAWDLTMDPLMVLAGHWTWEVQGAYFGVPIQNFLGWWFTTFVTVLLFLLVWPKQLESDKDAAVANARWDRWAFLAYVVTGFGDGTAAATYGLAGAALVGYFSMAPWILLAWWKTAAVLNPERNQ